MQQLMFEVEKIESKKFDTLTTDEREILRDFHSQLSVNPTSFSIYGIFVMDLSLFARILAGIISFIFILVQFHANQK